MNGNQELIRNIFEVESSALLEFLTINYSPNGDPNSVLYFHGGCNLDGNGVRQNIVFKNQTYIALPLETSDFEVRADQRTSRPHVKFLNSEKYISQILRRYNRLINAKVTRQKVFIRDLDPINFPGGINPYNNPNPNSTDNTYLTEIYFVNRVVNENRQFVEFELSSSLELENIKVGSSIYSFACRFCYRGQGCKYSGPPKLNSQDGNFTDVSGNSITSLNNRGQWQPSVSYSIGDYVSLPTKQVASRGANPTDITYVQAFFVCKQSHISQSEQTPFLLSNLWERDNCSKRYSGCKARFPSSLSYGGFVSTSAYGS